MTAHDRAAYEGLRAYLAHLLLVPHDRALASVPLPLRTDLEAFLQGKTLYHDAADHAMVYGHDLAAWAYQVVYLTGLTYPIKLATVDVVNLHNALAALGSHLGDSTADEKGRLI